MYDFLNDLIDQKYTTVNVFKSTPEKYLAWIRHKETHQDLVIRRYTGNPESYQMLLKIRSPYLPEIYEVAVKGGQVLVLEEHIEGDSVYDLLAESVFPPKEVRRITLDVCRALYILHEHGLVHRDVKPENILLRGSSTVLLDFDAARVVKVSHKTDTQVLGTVGYAPPEQIEALHYNQKVRIRGHHEPHADRDSPFDPAGSRPSGKDHFPLYDDAAGPTLR